MANQPARAGVQVVSGYYDGAFDYITKALASAPTDTAKRGLREAAAGIRWQQTADLANNDKWIAAEKSLDVVLKQFPNTDSADQARRWADLIRGNAREARARSGK